MKRAARKPRAVRRTSPSAAAHEAAAQRATAPLTAAVVTASDTRTLADDASGDRLVRGLVEGGIAVVDRRIVHDDVRAIAAAVKGAIGAGADAVIVTGGTGVSPRDVTPEALGALGLRELPGFGEAFRAMSYGRVGPPALLSRAIAGTIGTSAVYALPGSPDACALALDELILPGLKHLLHHLRGGRPRPARGGPSQT